MASALRLCVAVSLLHNVRELYENRVDKLQERNYDYMTEWITEKFGRGRARHLKGSRDVVLGTCSCPCTCTQRYSSPGAYIYSDRGIWAYIHRVRKKKSLEYFRHNFIKYRSIFKIFSLSESPENLQ